CPQIVSLQTRQPGEPTRLLSVEYPVRQRILTFQILPFSSFSFYALFALSGNPNIYALLLALLSD
ncbi:MAG: hypothetical protein AAFR83_09945, partial [Cyanobacteria bacterium J06629_18]